jgi:dihydrolipoamide dehydrogenase
MAMTAQGGLGVIMQKLTTDVAVVGAGTAGLAAYRAAKAAGRSALLIEGGVYGTTCARVGCMPSKLLIAPADALHALDRFPGFGLHLEGHVKVDGRAVMARVRRERDRFVGFVVQGVDGIPVHDRLDGYARFVDDHTLDVRGVEVKAKATVIATGSSPVYPAAWASLGDRLVTNETVFEWTDLPESVAVFGPGVIGLELGQALHRLGVRVEVFGRGGGVGPLTDPAVVAEARRIFAGEFHLDTDPGAEVWREGDRVAVRHRSPDGGVVVEHFDYLLAATGRVPNVAKLGLEHTTIARDARGVPLFDRETMQCGTAPIFIAGDADDDLPLLHEAADEGRIAGENAARFPDVRPGLRRAPLGIVFSDPQLAVVGGGHRAAQSTGFVTGAVSFDDQGRARVMQRNRGLLHVYAEIGTGAFLGAEMIAPDAEHLGHLLAWARQLDLTIAQMLTLPFYHPVIEEGLRTALRDAYAKLDAAAKERRAA